MKRITPLSRAERIPLFPGLRSVLLGVVVGLLVAPSSGLGASFTQRPSQNYYSSGTGPFSWWFVSSQPTDSEYGWACYMLSSEGSWHRCLSSGQASVSGLPDGTYTIQIADDVNTNWLNARGLFFSGANTCADGQAPDNGVTTDTIVIDSVPPTVGVPVISVDGKTAQITSSATDGGSGVQGYRWAMGDGTSSSSPSGSVRYTYLSYGAYNGSVAVTDRAGNTTTNPFTVTLSAPPSGTTPTSSQPATNPQGAQPQQPSNGQLSPTRACRHVATGSVRATRNLKCSLARHVMSKHNRSTRCFSRTTGKPKACTIEGFRCLSHYEKASHLTVTHCRHGAKLIVGKTGP
jgi:hypothetical protein